MFIEFRKIIESIGFKFNDNYNYYEYKKFRIYLYNNYYNFYNGSEWIRNIDYNDLTPLKQITRSYKLKKILG